MASNPYLPDSRTRRFVARPDFGRPGASPQASPVDTYVRPGTNKAEQLAQALSNLEPRLAQASGVLSDRLIESQEAEALAAAERDAAEAKDHADLIKRREMLAGSSPWFMAAYNERMGQLSGHRLVGDLEEAFKASPEMQNATTLDEFQEFTSSFISSWLEENGGVDSQRYGTALQRVVNAHVHTRMMPAFVKAADERLRYRDSQTRRGLLTAGLVQDSPVDSPMEHLVMVARQNRQMGASMTDPFTLDEDMLEGIVAAAMSPKVMEADRAYEYLEIAEHLESGVEGVTLANTEYGRERIEEARREIHNIKNRERLARERARKEEIKEIKFQAMANSWEILGTPDADFGPVVRPIMLVDPEAGLETMELLNKAQTQMLKASPASNVTYYSFLERIWTPGENLNQISMDIVKAIGNGLMSQEQRFRLQRAMTRRMEAQKRLALRGREVSVLENNSFLKQVDTAIREAIPHDTLTTSWEDRVDARTDVFEQAANDAINGVFDPMDALSLQKYIKETLVPLLREKRAGVRIEGTESPANPLTVREIERSGTAPKKTPEQANRELSGAAPVAPPSADEKKEMLQRLLDEHGGNKDAANRAYIEWLKASKRGVSVNE